MMTRRESAATRRSGLLFPDGPTRRDYRPLVFFVLGATAVAGWFTVNRKDPVPAPAIGVAAARASQPVAVALPPAAAGQTANQRIPQTWEELTASRAAALAAARVPEAVEEEIAEPEAASAPARRAPARERSRPRAQPQIPPPPGPPAPSEVAAASPDNTPGRLTISSTPWGQLIVDGRVYGNTPRIGLTIAVGQRRLRVARDGFAPFDTTITVEPGAVIRLTGITLREQP